MDGVPSRLNFRCPASPIVCELGANSQCNLFMATKLDPEVDEWGDFDWQFTVVDNFASNAG